VPIIVLAISFIFGFIIKIILKNRKSPYAKQLRLFFAYNFFLTVWSIMFMPILYQGWQYVLYLAFGFVELE